MSAQRRSAARLARLLTGWCDLARNKNGRLEKRCPGMQPIAVLATSRAHLSPRRPSRDEWAATGAMAARHGFAPLIASLCRPPVRERMPRDIRTELGRPQLSEFGRPGGGPAGAKRRSVGISMPGRIRAVPPSCWSLAMPPLLSPLSVPESWHQQDIRVCLSSLPARCLASTGALDGERSGQ